MIEVLLRRADGVGMKDKCCAVDVAVLDGGKNKSVLYVDFNESGVTVTRLLDSDGASESICMPYASFVDRFFTGG